MPAVPPPPTPIVPQPPDYPSSGLGPISGSPGTDNTFSGPFFIEKQTMNIDYARVPLGQLSSCVVSLSSVAVTEKVNNTVIVAIVRAAYSSRKSYKSYDSSTYQQPQKFEVLAGSADAQGNTYGDITASTMGPVGSIVTKAEWYYRVPWQDYHVEVNNTNRGFTFYAVERDDAASSTVNCVPYMEDFKKTLINSKEAGTLTSNYDVDIFTYHNPYFMPGGYATANESLWQIIDFIDDMGTIMTNEQLFKRKATHTEDGLIYPDQGLAQYDTTRHDYS